MLKLIKIGVLLKLELIGRMQGRIVAWRDFLGEQGSIGVSEYPSIRVSEYPSIRVSEYPSIRSGYLFNCLTKLQFYN